MSLTRAQKGAGLIEILVTVLVLATALLALGAMQVRSLQFNHSAYLRSQANILASDIADRMRLNRANLSSYSIDFEDTAPTGSSLASTDIREWLTTVANTLPGGDGALACTSTVATCRIEIKWSEQNSSRTEEEDTTTFIYETRI
jgi:type IV pilus assembly protein PilV